MMETLENIHEEKVKSMEHMLEMTTNYMLEIEENLKQRTQELEEAYKQISHSLRYSAFLQKTIQPSKRSLKEVLKDFFVLNQPKDIIGGDFLWMRQSNNLTFIAVADCTGHGVPGAMLTMAAHFCLNEVYENKAFREPDELLAEFNARFYQIFNIHQNNAESFSQGLDISLVIIDKEALNIRYCGTNQSLFRISQGILTEYKGNRSYLGTKNPDLSLTHEIDLKSGDRFYTYTDGIPDQFGGKRNKKFKRKRVVSLIQSISGLNLPKQGEIMTAALNEWQGSLEQTDDQLMLAFKV